MIVTVSQNFTRPADTTAYADGDLIANSTTAGSVVPLLFVVPGPHQGIRILGARISKTDETDVANTQMTLHFYTDSPTCANGDNGAWSTDLAGYVGSHASGAVMTAFTDEAAIKKDFGATPITAHLDADSKLYALLEADAAYTPASAEVFTVRLWVEKL